MSKFSISVRRSLLSFTIQSLALKPRCWFIALYICPYHCLYSHIWAIWNSFGCEKSVSQLIDLWSHTLCLHIRAPSPSHFHSSKLSSLLLFSLSTWFPVPYLVIITSSLSSLFQPSSLYPHPANQMASPFSCERSSQCIHTAAVGLQPMSLPSGLDSYTWPLSECRSAET